MTFRWTSVQEVWAVVRPCWLAAVIVIAISLALLNGQAVDALVSIAVDEGFFSLRHFLLFLSILILAASGWYFPRALLYVEYWITPQDKPIFERVRRWVPRALGTAPILFLAFAYLRGGQLDHAIAYLLVATVFVVLLIVRRRLLLRRGPNVGLHKELPKGTFWAMLGVLALSVVLFVGFLLSPVRLAQIIGPLGIVLIAASSWIAVGSVALIYPPYHYRWPSFVVGILVVSVIVGLWNDNHEVRAGVSEEGTWTRETVTEHFAEWLDHRRPAWTVPRRADSVVPVFVASAEGGGIRAAYWTASVLAHLEDTYPRFACHLFAVSGVSGGSLGAAVFTALLADALEESRYACDEARIGESLGLSPSVRSILAEDFLGPTLAGMLFPDLVQRIWLFSGALAFPDRAKYLERAWEQAWQEHTGTDRFGENFRGLWRSQAARETVPSLFLNGTWVHDGGRNVTSNVTPESSKFVMLDDVIQILQRPLPLSTAVHMSARFTYVSPAGTVPGLDGKRYIVDGGYFENSGAMTAAEIVAIIDDFCEDPARCSGMKLVPVVLIISNDSANPNNPAHPDGRPVTAPRFLKETLAPVRTLLNTRTARGYLAEDLLERTVPDGAALRFQLTEGEGKVPLGWMLSGEVRSQMDGLLPQLPDVVEVGRWLGRSTAPSGLD